MAENGALQLTERKWKIPLLVFFRDARLVFKTDELGLEILRIAVPAAMALAADPVASLIDTAFIGHLGPVEIAAVGVSIAIFNQASKVTIFPLVSITTSFVAEEDTFQRITNESQNGEGSEKDLPKTRDIKEVVPEDVMLENLEKGSATDSEKKDSIPGDANCKATTCKSPSFFEGKSIKDEQKNNKGRRHIPSASTALIVGGILGLVQAIFLIFCAKPLLSIMGVKSGSPMLTPARKYLTLRALGSPAVLLSLAMQGVFRGFKDTKTPLYATVAGDLANIILDPIFIFTCRLGVSGAAIAHVLSQYLISLILLWRLMKNVDLLPPSPKDLQFGRFLKNGFLLLARVIAATICVTLAASRAARLGSTRMAAFQICLQVWLTSSLLADGLAVAGQAIIACAFAEKDYQKATTAATRVLQMSFVLGLGLAAVVGIGLHFGDGIFSKDPNVLDIISIGIPFVAATQPINSIAFVFDGVNFGASDFAYSAYSMVLVAVASIAAIFVLSKTGGFVGIWIALTIFMGLRTFAGVWRMGTGTGPWNFLRGKLLP
ncbi:protein DETOXIFICATION 43 [Ricinus communis]|uniref:Protein DETOXIFICATION n=1 Tax=Ricinus communis TaxID=3988 RepID=B9T1P4_RICCO|nr:protein DETOXIFICATION 43 [Ricinus communis]XP_025015387.1 protein DETOXIFICATION 43 [Ricinus communis]EEF30216.1 DNA-damage-inducible protein f, putative [Ricinus communis]|eukprot:XP_015582695.1 protein DETOXIFICATION 43 [Ricinus communis]